MIQTFYELLSPIQVDMYFWANFLLWWFVYFPGEMVAYHQEYEL